jgi:hypothetical protein
MAKRIVAKAGLDNGVTFSVQLANLTPNSVFIITDRKLSFRENVKLTAEGTELRGEVVFVAQESPRGAVLVFEPSGPARIKLSRWMEQGEILHAYTPDELWSDSTEPAPEVDTDEMAKQALAQDQDDTGIEMALPILEEDGTLEFASAADYRAQYQSDIVKGGLVARSPPLPLGTQRMVRLNVPGAKTAVAVSVRVGFVGSGTVGLMIDSFSKHKHIFDQLFRELL